MIISYLCTNFESSNLQKINWYVLCPCWAQKEKIEKIDKNIKKFFSMFLFIFIYFSF